MTIPPRIFKWTGVVCIVAGIVGWPISALSFAKGEPAVVLALSWLAIIFTGLAFFTAAQDGVTLDKIYDLLKESDKL